MNQRKKLFKTSFYDSNVHLAGCNTTWIPLLWLHTIRNHLVTSVWWHMQTSIKTHQEVLFSLKNNSLINIFSTGAFGQISCPWLSISRTRAFCSHIRISPKLLLDTFQILWDKGLHAYFHQTHLSFESSEKEDVKALLIHRISKEACHIWNSQLIHESTLSFASSYLWGSWLIHLLEGYL